LACLKGKVLFACPPAVQKSFASRSKVFFALLCQPRADNLLWAGGWLAAPGGGASRTLEFLANSFFKIKQVKLT